MNRRTRWLAAILAAGTLVFAQLAVSAFACPMVGGMPAASNMTEEDCASAPAGAPLCEQHCQDAKASLDQAKPWVGAIDVGVPAVHPSRANAALRIGVLAPERLRVSAQSPPFIRFTVLRI